MIEDKSDKKLRILEALTDRDGAWKKNALINGGVHRLGVWGSSIRKLKRIQIRIL